MTKKVKGLTFVTIGYGHSQEVVLPDEAVLMVKRTKQLDENVFRYTILSKNWQKFYRLIEDGSLAFGEVVEATEVR